MPSDLSLFWTAASTARGQLSCLAGTADLVLTPGKGECPEGINGSKEFYCLSLLFGCVARTGEDPGTLQRI